MPNAIAPTFAVVEYANRFKPAFNTNPVNCKTPCAKTSHWYSRYSPAAGVVEVDNATDTETAELLLLTMFKVATVNVFVGTVYTTVQVTAERSAYPNLPVAMFYFSVNFIVIKSSLLAVSR